MIPFIEKQSFPIPPPISNGGLEDQEYCPNCGEHLNYCKCKEENHDTTKN